MVLITPLPKLMSTTKPTQKSLGFTLLELLIVVVILSTLAAVVVPSFSESSAGSQTGVVNQNIKIVQSAIDRFHITHGYYPGPSNWGKGCSGFSQNLHAKTQGQYLRNRLTLYTNRDGVVCDSRTDQKRNVYPLGPYLRHQIPLNPVNNSRSVYVYASGSTRNASAEKYGWAYSYDTGYFSAVAK